MTRIYTSAIAALCLSFGAVANAQEATPPAPADGGAPAVEAPAETPVAPAGQLSLGQPADTAAAPPADGPGSVYVQTTSGDWELRCLRAEDGSDPCQLYQLLKDAQGNSVAEISLFPLAPGNAAVVGATFAAPLETLLTEQLRLQVDAGTAKLYPFTWCAADGCIARIGLTEAEVESFKRGNAATAVIVPVVAPDQQVVLKISLKGFTAGYEALLASFKPDAAAPAADAPADAPAEAPAPAP
jgi:invasion protein IalB